MGGFKYNPDNILAKVLRGELPSTILKDTEYTFAIRDIRPQAPDHILVLPKGPYVCFDHFQNEADPKEITDFFETIRNIVNDLGLSPADGGGGYRLIANTGADGFQEIAHFHMHILSGRWLGPLLPSESDVEAAQEVFGLKLSNDELLNGPSK